MVVHILWCRDSDVDNCPKVKYHPSHFVPLFLLSNKTSTNSVSDTEEPKAKNQKLFNKNYSQPFNQRGQ